MKAAPASLQPLAIPPSIHVRIACPGCRLMRTLRCAAFRAAGAAGRAERGDGGAAGTACCHRRAADTAGDGGGQHSLCTLSPAYANQAWAR